MGGRVALVTGGSRGIGAAVSERLSKSGTTVVAAYRCDDAAAANLQRRTGIQTVQADVGDPAACAALVGQVSEDHGRLDLLVNSAPDGVHTDDAQRCFLQRCLTATDDLETMRTLLRVI